MNYFIEKGHGLDLAIDLDIISSVTQDFYSFFLKGIIITHEIKTNSWDFQYQISLYIIYFENKFQFSTNCQNISCSILSQLGLTNKLAYFLEGLRS